MTRITTIAPDHYYLFGRWFQLKHFLSYLKLVGNTVSVTAAESNLIHFTSIWLNSRDGVIYFRALDIDGGWSYRQTFGPGALPNDQANYWSAVVRESGTKNGGNIVDRAQLNRFSYLQRARDGSLTLGFGPVAPRGVATSNWMPTRVGRKYDLIYRFYRPANDLLRGDYFPPALERVSARGRMRISHSL